MIKRYYTRFDEAMPDGSSVVSDLTLSRQDVVIKEPDGRVVFEMKDVEAPHFWSNRARRVVAQKYFVQGHETSVVTMCEGVVETIANSGFDQGYFANESRHAFYDELLYMLLHQFASFNSPVWFNVRLWHRYKLKGSGGNWAWSDALAAAERMTTSYERPQCSACFILDVEDNLVGDDGIHDTLKEEARIFKYGSGSGVNYSSLREKDAPLNVGGGSSGLLSFLEIFDTSAKATKSGGTTRRAARMVCIDDSHPDLMAVIGWKAREEKKAQSLIKDGWSGGMDGEAYHTVSGQNANISIRFTDDFMRAVRADAPWTFTSRVPGVAYPPVPAKKIWRHLAECAWACADPGVQFDTTINAMHTCTESGRITASNPCSEYMHINNSACNLASLRLVRFLKRGSDGKLTFDIEGYKHTIRTFITAMDILVDLSSYPTKKIAENAHNFRQLGIGYADLGALLMRLGVPYDSDEGRYIAGALTSLLTATAYDQSADLAIQLGAFPAFTKNRTSMLKVLAAHHHKSEIFARTEPFSVPGWARAAFNEGTNLWGSAYAKACTTGIRNSQASVLAPTGTIGFAMDCDTTGIEPMLGHVQYKTLAGGGLMTLVNASVDACLYELGYGSEERGRIVKHVEETGGFSGAPDFREEHLPVFDTSFPSGRDGRSIRWQAHLLMMAAAQPFLSGAISKTINMPESSTVEDVEACYMLGWELGLKAVAIYRDGCKQSQPVSVLGKAKDAPEAPATPLQELLKAMPLDERLKALRTMGILPEGVVGQRKLPDERNAKTQKFRLGGTKFFLHTGMYEDGSLGEIFVEIAKEGKTLSGLLGNWAKAVSIGTQHGVPWSKYIEAFVDTQYEPSGMVQHHPTIKVASSLTDLIMRHIAVKFFGRTDLQNVKPEDASLNAAVTALDRATAQLAVAAGRSGDGPPCAKCHALTVKAGACHVCPNCGDTTGCG